MKQLFILFIITILFTSCNKNTKGVNDLDNRKIFNLLSPKDTGITFSNNLTETDSLNYLNYAYIYMGGGIAAGDINNDGLTDLFFTGNMVPNRLYINKGHLKFEDISEKAGVLGDKRWFTGVTMADVNNDGFLDIYCSVAGKFKPKENLLYINNGDSTFNESAKKYGIADIGNSIQASFFDYDNDGDLDLYVANYPPTNFNAPNYFYQYKLHNANDIESDKLYRNDGDRFVNVTDQAGLRSYGLSNSVTVGDINNDGWQDIYISNDFSMPDFLYINNKNGTFSERIKESTKQTAYYGMGVDIADYNNDGLLDIIQMDMTPGNNRRSKANMSSMNPKLFWGTVNAGFGYQYMQNTLQLNNGSLNNSMPDFSNVSRLAGIATTDWSWGPLFADLDNDGWKDVFISNGTRREINNKDFFDALKGERLTKDSLLKKTLEIPSEKIDNFVYKNNGDLTFSKANEKWGIVYKGFSNGCIYADLDNDGDLEIVTNNIDDVATFFENKSDKKNNYITLKFAGTDKNKFGLGVKVNLQSDSLEQFQEMTLTRGFQSSIAPQLHFGLGKSEIINQLKVTWPDGKVQILKNIPANQTLLLKYEDSAVNKIIALRDRKYLFTDATVELKLKHKHSENSYDDFKKEVLLPHRTSTFGPYLSVGDLNGDGKEDFFISGSSQYKTGLYFQTDEGFQQEHTILDEDNKYEDMGSLMFDADSDGDLDLYVVSGGNEFEAGSEMLQDRLYRNDGSGNFSKTTDALPIMHSSGSRVYEADFDNDGDLDLFVCGRLVPGNYPSPAKSYILENKSTPSHIRFEDVTEQISPQLVKLGLVTAASWTDIDNDGWMDLIVVGEWMPVRVFKNINGKLKEVSGKMGLDKTTGWWFSMASGDFDNDGDQDYILGNLGLNYKYQSKGENTFDIYLNDFDKNNHQDIVLSYYNEGQKYPVRGRECSSQQIPAIKEKFKNYDSYSNASLVDIYTEKDLNKSLHYQVNTFSSVYMENKGDKFVLHKLNNMAQFSSINQIIPYDFDGDNNLDFIIAGNLYDSEVETPRNDAGIGLFMKGDGQGNFKAIPFVDSGLFMDKDVKDLAMITIKGKKIILVANNDDYMQVIKFN